MIKYIHTYPDKTDFLNRNKKGMGLKISTKKTKLITINAKNNNAVVVGGQERKDMDRFDHLGARITNHRGAVDDIKSSSGKAKVAFNKLVKIQENGQLSKYSNISIFNSNLTAVLLCECKTWVLSSRVTKMNEVKLDTFLHTCLKRLLIK